MAAAMACRIWPALGSSERCSADTKRASAPEARMLRWRAAGHMVSLLGPGLLRSPAGAGSRTTSLPRTRRRSNGAAFSSGGQVSPPSGMELTPPTLWAGKLAGRVPEPAHRTRHRRVPHDSPGDLLLARDQADLEALLASQRALEWL